jgi:hypothetical protein
VVLIMEILRFGETPSLRMTRRRIRGEVRSAQARYITKTTPTSQQPIANGQQPHAGVVLKKYFQCLNELRNASVITPMTVVVGSSEVHKLFEQ